MRQILILSVTAIISLIAVITVFSSNAAVRKVPVNNERGAQQQMRLQYKDISPAEAKKRMESGEKIILLDVRTKEEYAEKHIPGSKLIPVDIIEKEALNKLTDKDSTIFVYCRSGNRSTTASKILVNLGYANVYNLGGIIDWKYETESGEYKQ